MFSFHSHRKRSVYTLLVLIVMASGLLTRRYSTSLPTFFAEYAGDTLWALMVFCCAAWVFPKHTSLTIAMYALLFSYTIEISQLYHAPWIDHIRDTRLGGLVLGHVFVWSDLLCYTVGILIGFVGEKIMLHRQTSLQ